ncbi:MAG TPA: nucleotidyltransferase family protein [Nocardioidaceae bacterium]|nr:nucleotidyltransferase family protein [Nocardioidaceae bacterium]
MSPVLGLLLAAGAGRRMGGPKALLREPDGTAFLTRAVAGLRDGGCDTVTAVLGAEAERAAELLDPDVRRVVAADWAEGMGASLRAGLGDALEQDATCAVVTLVDLPDVDARVVRRLLARVGTGPQVLARAGYDGRPGHPVVLGRDHWAGVAAAAEGDQGARDYLRTHEHLVVECGDLATGVDVDHPEQLRGAAGARRGGTSGS